MPEGGGQEEMGSGAGIGAATFLALGRRFGATFFFVVFLVLLFAAALVVFFFLRAGAAFFLVAFLVDFFAMIVLPIDAEKWRIASAPVGDRIAPNSFTRQAE
jgi:hypothetical protein